MAAKMPILLESACLLYCTCSIYTPAVRSCTRVFLSFSVLQLRASESLERTLKCIHHVYLSPNVFLSLNLTLDQVEQLFFHGHILFYLEDPQNMMCKAHDGFVQYSGTLYQQ